jgi:hypothetical protein
LHVLDILKSNGLEDAVWALKAFSPDQCRMLAIGAARQLQHVWSDAETLLDMAEAYVIKKPEAPSLIELTKQITLARYKAESDTRTDAEKTAQRAMYYSLKTAMAMPTSISAMSGMAESALLLVNYAGSLQDVPEYDPVGTFTKACIFVEERGVD